MGKELSFYSKNFTYLKINIYSCLNPWIAYVCYCCFYFWGAEVLVIYSTYNTEFV